VTSVELEISDAFEMADEAALARAHSSEYLAFLQRLHHQVSSHGR
jgi:hypothetical protein